jgi:hypothetical protein
VGVPACPVAALECARLNARVAACVRIQEAEDEGEGA